MATTAPAPATSTTPAPAATPTHQFKVPDQADLSICKGPSLQAPYTCYDHHDLAKIVVREVGEASFSKTYEIPHGLLRWHSSYFAAALDPDNDFKENTDGELSLEGSIAVFDAFQCWLFTGRLKDPLSDTTNATAAEVYLPNRTLCKIWVFADMRGVPGLGNAAIDMLHEAVAASWSTPGQLTSMVYKATSAGCGLRKFLDAFTRTKNLSGFLDHTQRVRCPADFLYDAIPILVRRGEDTRVMSIEAWTELDRCQWHDHSGPGGKLRLESRK